MSNIPIYNECKNGNREPDYLHPKLKEILKPTWCNNLSRTSHANSPGSVWIYGRRGRYFKKSNG